MTPTPMRDDVAGAVTVRVACGCTFRRLPTCEQVAQYGTAFFLWRLLKLDDLGEFATAASSSFPASSAAPSSETDR